MNRPTAPPKRPCCWKRDGGCLGQPFIRDLVRRRRDPGRGRVERDAAERLAGAPPLKPDKAVLAGKIITTVDHSVRGRLRLAQLDYPY